jgi:hypothetical protein
MADFDIAPSVPVALGDDVDACRASIKPFLALYVGGMGARGKNFYYDLACRYGFTEAADRVQDLYLAGQKQEAAAAIPDALVDAVALCGPKERIAERLAAWEASPITTLCVTTFDPAAVQVMADLVLGADAGQPDRTISIPAPAPTAAPSPQDIFDRMADRVAQTPALVQQVRAVFQFDLAGAGGGAVVCQPEGGRWCGGDGQHRQRRLHHPHERRRFCVDDPGQAQRHGRLQHGTHPGGGQPDAGHQVAESAGWLGSTPIFAA